MRPELYVEAWQQGYGVYLAWGKFGLLLRPVGHGWIYLQAWRDGYARAHADFDLDRIRQSLREAARREQN